MDRSTVSYLKLGYKASNEQFAPQELLRYGVLAEECGFDSVFVSDHLQPWRHDGGHAPFAMTWLGALGARTERILMGTSVLTPTFRYHPAIVAQAFHSCDSNAEIHQALAPRPAECICDENGDVQCSALLQFAMKLAG